jgi:hypothetical protein
MPMQDVEAGAEEWKEYVGGGAFLSVFSSRKKVKGFQTENLDLYMDLYMYVKELVLS